MTIRLFLFCILCSVFLHAQEETLVLHIPQGDLEGSLLLPTQKANVPVVLLIAGSGPTDRNGNQDDHENNSLKMIAEELQKDGIASLRFDKRGVGQSSDIKIDEMELRFDTYVGDARAWIDLLAKDVRFNRIIVAGHSEGALLGLLASVKNKKVSAYVSISGAGRPIDEILKEQLAHIPNDVKTIVYGMLDKLKKGDTLGNVPPIFYALFRPTVQPYMISWMKYNPQTEIKKLKIPILIVNGTTDIQVKETDARLLAKSQPTARLAIIKNMNHVLKTCDTLDKTIQMKIYEDPVLPLNTEFTRTLLDFLAEQKTVPKSALIKK